MRTNPPRRTLCTRFRALVSALILASALGFGACVEEQPTETTGDIGSSPSLAASLLDTTEYHFLAKSFALALGDSGLRQQVKADMASSPVKESKLHLNTYVEAAGQNLLQAAATASAEKSLQQLQGLLAGKDVEFYMPVDAHRETWSGHEDLWVVWYLGEGFQPSGYDVSGKPVDVNETEIPKVPILVITPSETDFTQYETVETSSPPSCSVQPSATLEEARQACRSQLIDPQALTPDVPYSGVYVTKFYLDDVGEAFLNGDPEIDIFTIGPAGEIQCSGEGAFHLFNQPGVYDDAYYFDLVSGHDWFVNSPDYKPVLLVSDSQMAAAQTAPDHGVVHLFYEDDSSTQCAITGIAPDSVLAGIASFVINEAINVLAGDTARFNIAEGASWLPEFFTGGDDDFLGWAVLKDEVLLDLQGDPRYHDHNVALVRIGPSVNGWAIIENLGAGQEPLYPACLNGLDCGGIAPARTVTGNADGPTVLTNAGQIYYWDWSWVEGCDDGPGISCSYRWFRKDQGEVQWTLVGQSPEYSYLAPLDTFTFDLNGLVIRNVDVPVYQTADTLVEAFAVQVITEPLDPVSVSISGPDFITTGEENTWYSVVSGGLGFTTYLWERSTQYESGSYGPWQEVGTAQNHTTTYTNCENFKLKLTATRQYPVGQNEDSAIKNVTVLVQGECDAILDPG